MVDSAPSYDFCPKSSSDAPTLLRNRLSPETEQTLYPPESESEDDIVAIVNEAFVLEVLACRP
jgi:hypothetical protein